MYRIVFCVHDDDLLLLAAAAPPLHAGQEEEVANRTALGVQIPGRSRNAPALAAAGVVVGKVPDFWVTLTKFAVDCKFSVNCSDAENHQQQEEVQLVSRTLYFPSSSSSQFFCLMQIVSRNLHVQRDDSTLQCFIIYNRLTLL
jgi:hypothetical protein